MKQNEVSRRELTSLLCGVGVASIGVVALSGCGQVDAAQEVAEQSLSGTDVKWVDNVLGPNFPTSRNGDLSTTTGTALGATVVHAKGCRVAGDGGGGSYYWNSSNGTDNGGTVIVPGGTTGSVGAHWRKIG